MCYYLSIKMIKRECLLCNKVFYVKPCIVKIGKGIYCSSRCHKEDRQRKARGRVIARCEMCGLNFEARICDIKRGYDRFCSAKCMYKWRSITKSGENHQCWKGGKSTFKCLQCGREFEEYENRTKRRKFCSKRCLNKWQEMSLEGKNNPNWKNGISTENNLIRTSAEYEQWKTKVSERDNYTCVRCMKRGGDLNTHHIIPFSVAPEERLEVSNGATLCIPCHKWIHSNQLSA